MISDRSCLLVAATFTLDGMVAPEVLLGMGLVPHLVPGDTAIQEVLLAQHFRMRDEATTSDGKGAISINESSTSRANPLLLRADRTEEVPAGVAHAQLLVGNMGTCMILLYPTDRGASASALAAASQPWVKEVIAALTPSLSAILKGPRFGLLTERPEAILPAGALLWWHRISRGGDHGVHDHVGAETIPLGEYSCEVGYTESYLHGGDGLPVESETLDQIALGLFIASEDWLIADALNRLLTAYLLVARQRTFAKPRVQELDRVVMRGQDLAIGGQLIKLYMDERDRYLAVGRRAIWRAARTAWGLEGEMGNIEGRVRAVNEQIAQLVTTRQGRLDSRRNMSLYVIAMLGLVAGVVSMIDFGLQGETHPKSLPLFIIAGVFTMATITAVAVLAVRQVADGRRMTRLTADEITNGMWVV